MADTWQANLKEWGLLIAQEARQELIATLQDYLTPLSPDVDTLLVIDKRDWQFISGEGNEQEIPSNIS